MSDDWLPGVHRAPNIHDHPDVYEIENRALDPDGRLEAALYAVAPWEDRLLVDLGCGTGFFLPHAAHRARHVVGVEPHGPTRARALARVGHAAAQGAEWAERVSVMAGSAEKILLPEDSVDVIHARFAYFWGPGCEAGLAECRRVLKPGGRLVVIDNDLSRGTFAAWLGRYPENLQRSAQRVEGFWAEQGFSLTRVRSCWRFQRREDLEAVVRVEFGVPDPKRPERALAESLIEEHHGLEIDYHYCLYAG